MYLIILFTRVKRLQWLVSFSFFFLSPCKHAGPNKIHTYKHVHMMRKKINKIEEVVLHAIFQKRSLCLLTKRLNCRMMMTIRYRFITETNFHHNRHCHCHRHRLQLISLSICNHSPFSQYELSHSFLGSFSSLFRDYIRLPPPIPRIAFSLKN